MPANTWNWLRLIILSLVWGSSFILIKKSLLALQPLQVASLRLTFASMVFIPFLYREFSKVNPREWKYLLAVGLTGSAIPAFLYAMAQTRISSSTNGVLNSLTPLFTLLIGIWFFEVRNSWQKMAGVLIGLVGALGLIISAGQNSDNQNLLYGLLVVAGTICYATSGNLVKRYLSHRSSFSISILSYATIGPFALLVLLGTGFFETVPQHEDALVSVLAVLFLALAGTSMASILYFRLVQDTDPLFASMVSYLIPLVAVCFGIWDGESFQVLQGLALILIISGVYLSRQ